MKEREASRAALLAQVILSAAAAGIFVFSTAILVREPYILNYTEGIVLQAAERLLRGGRIYPGLNEPPYVYFAYGPLHPLIGAGFVAVFGTNVMALRLLTAASEVAIALAGYRILRQHELSGASAGLGASLILAVLGMHKFHALARVDMLVLAAEFWAFSGLFGYLRGERTRELGILFLGSFIALLGKATAVIAVGAVTVIAILEMRRGRRRGLALMGTAAAVLAAYGLFLAIGSLLTGGEMYRFQFAYQGRTRFCNPLTSDCWEVNLLRMIAYQYGSLMGLGLLAALSLRGRAHILVLAALSGGWLLFAIFKDGSDLNYSIEFLVLVCVIIGLAWPAWARSLASRMGGRTGLATVLVSGGVVGLSLLSPLRCGLPARDWFYRAVFPDATVASGNLRWLVRGLGLEPSAEALARPVDQLSEESRRTRETLAGYMRHADGIVLAEEPFFAVVEGKEVWITDPFQTGVLQREGIFSMQPVTDALRDGRIRWVFAGWRLMELAGVKELLDQHYELVYTTPGPVAESYWKVFRVRTTPVS